MHAQQPLTGLITYNTHISLLGCHIVPLWFERSTVTLTVDLGAFVGWLRLISKLLSLSDPLSNCICIRSYLYQIVLEEENTRRPPCCLYKLTCECECVCVFVVVIVLVGLGLLLSWTVRESFTYSAAVSTHTHHHLLNLFVGCMGYLLQTPLMRLMVTVPTHRMCARARRRIMDERRREGGSV